MASRVETTGVSAPTNEAGSAPRFFMAVVYEIVESRLLS
jgi:hypothetical protein